MNSGGGGGDTGFAGIIFNKGRDRCGWAGGRAGVAGTPFQ